MSEHQSHQSAGMFVRGDQPLIGVIVERDQEQMVHYVVDEQDLEQVTNPSGIDDALRLAGAWSDLDWDEAQCELDHIRHDAPPTPPITEL